MKIGIDARFYGPVGKGLGRYTSELIKSLEEIDKENRYVIFLRRDNFDSYVPKNPRFEKRLADFRWYSLEEQVIFPIVLYRERCDLLHFPHFNVPIGYRGPFVVTVHDLILLRFPTLRATTLSPILYRMKFLAYRFVIWNALFRSQAIITVSEYAKADILDRYRVSSEKITVTYEAAHPFCFRSSPESSRDFFLRLGLLETKPESSVHGILKPFVLSVGNAYPHKNLEALVDAFADFPDDRALLVFVGWDEYFYPRLVRYVAAKNLSSVVFAKSVSDEELDLLYRSARISVFPSKYEGFGLPPLEAMGKGSPVLAANATAFPEILDGAADFFDPNDPGALLRELWKLWNCKDRRKDLRDRGYRRANEFSWERMGRETLQLYSRISGAKSAR